MKSMVELLSSGDLKANMKCAADMRVQATSLEKITIRSALQRTHGLLAPASELLGIRHQTLKDWLRRQHIDLGAEARAMRAKIGYRGGNPDLYDLNLPDTT